MRNDSSHSTLKVAYIVGSFPHISETFITNQITAVAARGQVVDIYTTCAGETESLSLEIAQSDLMRRICPIYPSGSRIVAIMKTLGLALRYCWQVPGVTARLIKTVHRHGLDGSLRLIYATFALLRRGIRRYDVIHAQFGTHGLLALRLVESGVLEGPIVTSFRGYDANQYLRTRPDAYRHLFARGALFLPVSHALAQRLIDAGCARSKIRVHHSGVRLAHFPNLTSNVPGKAVRLITVGRLVEKKGIADAIEAVARVVASGRQLSYRIVGEGPLRSELERLISRLGLDEQVQLIGQKPHEEVLRMIAGSDILVAPSVTAMDGDEEGIPNAVKEAMALGLPVISTRHGGIPELVEDGVSGFLVPERDPGSIAERLAYLLDRPERRTELGIAGRRRVRAAFDLDVLIDGLIAMYRRVAVENTATVNSPTLGRNALERSAR